MKNEAFKVPEMTELVWMAVASGVLGGALVTFGTWLAIWSWS